MFRIGVVGHRPNRLQEANLDLLSQQLRSLIETVVAAVHDGYNADHQFYREQPPVVRALTPLAEGVDRLFAEQSLAAGCQLTAILPFPKDEFEKDFSSGKQLEENSMDRFQSLLARAHTVLQMDGRRTDEARTYFAAGNVVLNQSDILFVVWDGDRRHFHGGTEETFNQAVAGGVPVVWIDAHAPHHWRLLKDPESFWSEIRVGKRGEVIKSQDLSKLADEVRRLIASPDSAVPKSAGHSHPANPMKTADGDLRHYLSEHQHRRNLAFVWKWFRNACLRTVGVRLRFSGP